MIKNCCALRSVLKNFSFISVSNPKNYHQLIKLSKSRGTLGNKISAHGPMWTKYSVKRAKNQTILFFQYVFTFTVKIAMTIAHQRSFFNFLKPVKVFCQVFLSRTPQSTYIDRDEIGGGVSALSDGAYANTLYVMR
jgi:hypothetical protein